MALPSRAFARLGDIKLLVYDDRAIRAATDRTFLSVTTYTVGRGSPCGRLSAGGGIGPLGIKGAMALASSPFGLL